jgi:hypothetical protein
MSREMLRASELGSFLYCQRAWGYGKQNTPSSQVGKQNAGSLWHDRHSRNTLGAGCLRTAGYLFVLSSFVLAAIKITMLVLG